MKIELDHTRWKGYWQECALCGEGFRAHEVEAYTILPGEHGVQAVCRQCALGGELGLKQRLIFRAWELRRLADQLEQACEEGIEAPTLGEFHNLERSNLEHRRAGRALLDLDIDES